MKKVYLLVMVMLSTSFSGKAQVGADSARIKTLKEYAASFNIDRLYNSNPNFRVDFSELKAMFGAYPNHFEANGELVYIDIDNEKATRVTKTNLVTKGSPLGYRLSGRGLRVGVIDEAGVRRTHVELENRVTQRDGDQTPNNHATHVAGTIGARGLNSLSRGMATEVLIDAYSFNGWESKLVNYAQNGGTISNHSYGIIAGWRQVDGVWRWYGSPNVSETEDHKFGFYANSSRFIDDFHNVYPHYLAIFSAGNNRNTSGPPANNPEHEIQSGSNWVKSQVVRGPNPSYGSMTYYPVSKNALAVGAINLGNDGQIAMSSFSSWGPTDDGRIKPDLVGQGVSVFSTVSTGDDRYGTLSGTSMSSPNVTGSLVLIKEHYKDIVGHDIRLSSTLKGIAIHTAVKPDGTTPGPDYRFGWGLLDMQRAIKFVDRHKDTGFFLKEDTLQEGQSKEYLISVPEGGPFTATLVWIDPPGRVPAVSLNPRDTILVNDLDIRVERVSDGQVFRPWVLNFITPDAPATTGINFLDNVEKVDIKFAEPGQYKIVVNHKKLLTGGRQSFSLLVSAGDLSDERRQLYFVGRENHKWNNPQNWSLSNGGPPANLVPTRNDVVNFTVNSFNLLLPMVIEIDEAAECQMFNYIPNDRVEFKLNADLTVFGSLNVNNAQKFTGSGVLRFSAELLAKNGINAPQADFSGVKIVMSGNENNRWELDGALNAGQIELRGGQLDLFSQPLKVKKLVISEENQEMARLILGEGQIFGLDTLIFNGATDFSAATNGSLAFNGESKKYFISGDGIKLNEVIIMDADATIEGSMEFNKLSINNAKVIFGNNTKITNLLVSESSQLTFASGTTITVANPDLDSEEGKPITLQTNGSGTSNFFIPEPGRYCWDDLIIRNVTLSGEATVAAGGRTEVEGNVQGWNLISCDDILFADFSFSGLCATGFTRFTSLSTGNIVGRRWDFGNPNAGQENNSTEENPKFIYPQPGTYTVTLTIFSATDTTAIARNVTIGPTSIVDLIILLGEGRQLRSNQVGTSYQWFRDGQAIEGANQQFISVTENGKYQVEVFRDGCSSVSPPFDVTDVITSISEVGNSGIVVYPNPFSSILYIAYGEGTPSLNVKLYDLNGRELTQHRFANLNSTESSVVSMEINSIQKGIYFLYVETPNGIRRFKVLKQ